MRLKLWKWLYLFGMCLCCLLIGQESYILIEDQTSIPILTPSLSQRQTLKMRLSNGLEAYLISDPEASQAGAVLTIQAGSWNDPKDYPGLAHFLEHLLFLGTEKYPIESDYDCFIRQHDGKSNAYTASDYTLYIFSITPSAFEEALDRFSYFFKKPLFNPSGVDRELHSINQEFAKNFNQEKIRENYVQKELANPQHPFHQFNAGNSSTLSKVSQKVLKQWYQNHYSAHLMRLIVYGPFPLDTLKTWVLQDFKDVPATGQQPSYPQIPALAEKMQGKIVYIEPMKNIRTLRLMWELPASVARQGPYKPEEVICSILGHEGPGSLLATLKLEHLAEDLNCAGYRLGRRHFLFSLSVNLTEEGLEKFLQVTERCLQAIAMLQKQETPLYLFEELKKIQTFKYQYQSRENTFDYLMRLGGGLVYEDLKTFPESALIPQAFKPALIREFLNYLTPQQMHLTLIARHPESTTFFDRQEQWMSVRYKIESILPAQVEKWGQLPFYSQLQLPAPNPFIPQELKLIHSNETQSGAPVTLPRPILLEDHEQAKIYFAADHDFQVPQIVWFFEIKTPSVEINDPIKVVLADLYIKCLEDTLNPYSYPAQLAHLNYKISRTENGILLSFTGYSEKAESLFDAIVQRLRECHPSECLFRILKDGLLRQYHNMTRENPLQQGYEVYQSILYQFFSTYQQRADALVDVTYESFLHYLDHLYDQTYIEGMLYGNINQEQAKNIEKKLQTTFASQVFPPKERLLEHIVVLPEHSGPYAVELQVQSPSNATLLSIENASFSFKARAAQQILAQAMSASFYSTLRTKQQTCYLLYSHAEEINKHLFTLFAVQSSTHDPRDLLSRFELFIEDFLQEMTKNELTKERFEFIRQSLLNTLEHSPQNLIEAGHLLKMLAFKYEGDFDWMAKRIQGFKDLTYEEFLEIARQFLGKQNKRRLALLVRGITDKDFHYLPVPSPQEMRQLSHYTSLDK